MMNDAVRVIDEKSTKNETVAINTKNKATFRQTLALHETTQPTHVFDLSQPGDTGRVPTQWAQAKSCRVTWQISWMWLDI